MQQDDKIDCNIKKHEVYLRIYDISNGMAKIMSEQLLGFKIEGIWHTALEVYGKEFYFQNGLRNQMPGTTPFGQCVERLLMGSTDCKETELLDFLSGGGNLWNSRTYDLFDNNCNHFTSWLCKFLLDKDIPKHILDLPERVKETEFFKTFIKAQYRKDYEDVN